MTTTCSSSAVSDAQGLDCEFHTKERMLFLALASEINKKKLLVPAVVNSIIQSNQNVLTTGADSTFNK